MDHLKPIELIELTEAEQQALRIVAGSGGRASWYTVERLVTPMDYPGQETNSIRILARLEQAGLIARTPESGHMRPFRATRKGIQRLGIETETQ